VTKTDFSKHLACTEIRVWKYGRSALADMYTGSKLEMTGKWEW